MRFRFFAWSAAMTLCVLIGAGAGHSANAPSKETPSVAQARQLAERGLEFLRKDALEWRRVRKCASCHQGTMTVWALAEAKSLGYSIPPGALAEMADWNKERLAGLETPRDGTPATKTMNSGALFTGLIAAAVPGQDAVSAPDVQRIVDHVRRYQEADGAWLWSPMPAKNRPPPVFESDEVATLLGDLVLGSSSAALPEQTSALRDGRDRAAVWLEKNSPAVTTQAQALRLLRDVWAHKPRKEINARVAQLLSLQNKDGGWSPEREVVSDAYATGQALYALSATGIKAERKEVKRAIAYLALNQEPDGSWFVTPRGHPGEKPFSNPSPISYFGSAWATMGLMRMAPMAIGAPARSTSGKTP